MGSMHKRLAVTVATILVVGSGALFVFRDKVLSWNANRSLKSTATHASLLGSSIKDGEPLPSSFPFSAASQSSIGVPREFTTLESAIRTCWPERAAQTPAMEDRWLDETRLSEVFGPVIQKTPLDVVEVHRSEDGLEKHILKKPGSSAPDVIEIDEDGVPLLGIDDATSGDVPNSEPSVAETAPPRSLVRKTMKFEVVLGDSKPLKRKLDGRAFDAPDSTSSDEAALSSIGRWTEVNGRIEELQIRSAGRLLHCSAFDQCECL